MNHARSRNEQPIHKAFEVLSPWCKWGHATPSIRYGESAQDVKHEAELRDIDGIKIRRCPEQDLFAPSPDECLADVPRHQQRILAHANGNDTSSHGFRSYYCTSKDDPDLLSLVEKGLMSGPVRRKGALPKKLAYFYLTEQGRAAARSLLPRRRGTKKHA
ncbi:hypothetical protein [Desulfoluna limicola]|uniref:hypothetical protein n=1 Tax=Desulfoluna limicola TaxID=2810562 RepID=UPI001F24E4E5|nr:hypothetical protein [Desulfoluna limicola]